MAEKKEKEEKKAGLWSGRMPELRSVNETSMWRQRVGVKRLHKHFQKEGKAQTLINEAKIKVLEETMSAKNTYLSKYTSAVHEEKEAEKAKTKIEVRYRYETLQFGFDKVYTDTSEVYCQKCKKTKTWCPHKVEGTVPKEVYALPATKYA